MAWLVLFLLGQPSCVCMCVFVLCVCVRGVSVCMLCDDANE
jgi:hypothetical protein